MITRVSSMAMQNSVLSQINANQNKFNDLQIQAMTGKKINNIYDDPSAAGKILGFNETLGKMGAYQKNVTVAQGEYSTQDGVLKIVADKLQRVSELNNLASNEYNTPETIQGIKNEVASIKQSLVDLANTQYDGRYIFSGSNTGTPAYTQDADGNVSAYGGNGETRSIEVGEGSYLTLNEPGDNIFRSAFDSIEKLQTALGDEAAGVPIDFDTIRECLNETKTNIESVTNIRTKFGTLAQKADMCETSLLDSATLLKGDRSKIQDIDTAEAYSNLVYQQYALQASMQISSMSLQPSLLNYI